MTSDRVAVIDPSNFTPPYNHHLCEGLADTGWEVKLFTSGETNWTSENYERVLAFYPLTEERVVDVLPERIRVIGKGTEHIIGMFQLIQRLNQWDPDIIHFQWLPLPVVDIPLVRLVGHIAPTVFTVHDSTPFQGAATSRIQRFMADKGPRVVDQVIVHTEKTKVELVNTGVSQADISVIPHGVIRHPSTDRLPTNTSDVTTVLFFGNVKPYKGVDVLIDAVARLPPEVRQKLRLVIAGRPHGSTDELKQRARKHGVTDSITWELGFIEHERVGAYFQESDVVVFPYRHIDQSGALMTALPFGKPVIATEVGGFIDVLTDGVHGRLVPPDNADALSSALAELLGDENRREEMGDSVAELANNTYSWGRIAKMTTDLYREAQRDRRA
ncbi:group 1 glycosyl transferase [Halorubrum distributum JCM 9100]|uniref:Group 1 glycosyl transferase n=2 Tax=Halorubrum distributum TaxID=29283 RepID=M0EF26_9EURY|nr:glycosyltransferase family 4 protein [Halorubrum distributum]ELZ45673.1 group 1 glycosyl transferase [Halorubrum distributum JCM 9100]ELZ53529.1 group 1 glycosyl transferase [Halorubrum distributum JCM 10118]